uniref:Uncharacterized protein n=1 Tax=Eutreptiella gymnastica TaxID=73025 RepID=A0A7S4CZW1_9EUGL
MPACCLGMGVLLCPPPPHAHSCRWCGAALAEGWGCGRGGLEGQHLWQAQDWLGQAPDERCIYPLAQVGWQLPLAVGSRTIGSSGLHALRRSPRPDGSLFFFLAQTKMSWGSLLTSQYLR